MKNTLRDEKQCHKNYHLPWIPPMGDLPALYRPGGSHGRQIWHGKQNHYDMTQYRMLGFKNRLLNTLSKQNAA
jgi:hypothetical protein